MLFRFLFLQGLVVLVTGVSYTCRSLLLLMRCDSFPAHPICASNGVTYSNDCEFARARCLDSTIHAVHYTACLSPTPVAEVVLALACPDVSHVDCNSQQSDAVCGNNGKVYSNMCHFEKARCTDHTLHQKPLSHCRLAHSLFSQSQPRIA